MTHRARIQPMTSKPAIAANTQKPRFGELSLGANTVQRDRPMATASAAIKVSIDIIGSESPLFSRDMVIARPKQTIGKNSRTGTLARRRAQIF